MPGGTPGLNKHDCGVVRIERQAIGNGVIGFVLAGCEYPSAIGTMVKVQSIPCAGWVQSWA